MNFNLSINAKYVLLAKRSKQDNQKAIEPVTAQIEATLFSKIVQDAGLKLNVDATQDELGK